MPGLALAAATGADAVVVDLFLVVLAAKVGHEFALAVGRSCLAATASGYIRSDDLANHEGEDRHQRAEQSRGRVGGPRRTRHPGIVHTFKNEGSGDARFLNFHSPGCDFAAQLRGEDVEFDSEDPPESRGRPASEATLICP